MSDRSPDLAQALAAAIEADDVFAVAALLEQGASANASVHVDIASWGYSDTPVLYTACHRKSEGIVGLLLSRGADANAYLSQYENMLHEHIPALVAAFPSAAIVERLLKAGADPNKGHWQREDAGWEQSPLKLAPTEEIKALLRRYGAVE